MASPYSSASVTSSAPSNVLASNVSQSPSLGSNASHREIYENERSRIQSSCFSRADADGQLLECYITHVRVIEDAQHPSAPPPQDYQPTPDARKNRVIIVAVRKSGRVRLHKARENNTGSFSIGKSWYLDDLTQLENNHNSTGFTATIGKPYYWQTRSSREKEAFVSSLFRIFRKYTGGRTPNLVGFDGIPSILSEGRPGTGSSDVFKSDPSNNQTRGAETVPNVPTLPHFPQAEHTRQQSSVSSHSSKPSIQSTADIEPNRPELHTKVSDISVGPRSQRRQTNDSARGALSPSVPDVKSLSVDNVRSSSGEDTAGSNKQLLTAGKVIERRLSNEMFGGDRASPDPPQEQKQVSPPRSSTPSKPKPQPIKTTIDASIPQPPSTANIIPPSPFTPGPKGGLGNKKSAKDIANRFQLAASAYAAGGALAKASKRPAISNPMPIDSSVASNTISTQEPQSAVSERPAIRELRRENSDGFNVVGVSISKDDLRKRTRSPTINNLQESIPERSPRRPESPAMQNLPEAGKAVPSISTVSLPLSTDTPSNETRTIEPEPLVVPSVDRTGPSEPNPIIQESQPPIAPARDFAAIPQTPPKPMSLEVPKASDSAPPVIVSGEAAPKKSSVTPNKHRRRRSAAANNARNKYLANVDLTNMTVDIDSILEEFSWDGRRLKVDYLETEVRKELARVESGNIWIANDEDNKTANEARIEELTKELDETLSQCDELDGLLTLYAVELMSLQEDIAYIENQSQGLQVQTANQKTLQRELELLLQTISIAPEEIETLQNAKVQHDQLDVIESSLSVLYKAILTIDPSIGSRTMSPETGSDEGPISDSGMGRMVALKDKKDKYTNDSRAFSRRLIEYMKIKYRQDLMTLVEPAGAITPTSKTNPRSPTNIVRPKAQSHMAVYHSLYKFAGLVLFTKDVDTASYFNLVKDYVAAVKDQFTEEIRGNVWGWKKIMRKPTAEDQEILFTHTEKESEGVTGTVRTLTVKRSATLAKTFRSPLGDSSSKAEKEKLQDGKIPGNECFSGFLDEVIPLVAAEQNFLSEFFHMSSANQSQNFIEFSQTGHPDDRQPSDLNRRRVPEQDKLVAKTLYDTMAEIFGFFGTEMQSFVGTITGNDPLQGVGVIYAVEKKLGQFREGTNQEFLVKCLLKLNEQMKGIFIKFLKEQVRAIEATKVKYRKKRTVLEFIKAFPLFSAKIEDQLPPEQLTSETFEVRDMVNNGYSILNRAMFDAMQAIAKQIPSANTQSVDPEDKESLNYHIMIIQNMDHYIEELEVRNNSILQDFKQKAEEEFKEHMALYIGAVIRRYLEKTIDFVEGVEALEQTLTPEEILSKKNYTKLKFRDILNDHQKEISGSHVKDGIKQLVKRVTKHFGDEGHLDPLSIRVLKEAESEYLKMVNRMNALLQGTYRDQGLEMPLKREDVTAAFAKQMSAK